MSVFKSDFSKKFKLKNGTEVEESTVVIVMMSLATLQADILTIHELLKKSQDPQYTMFGHSAQIAEDFQLTQNGVMNDATRNIISSAVVNHGRLNFSVTSPTVHNTDLSRVLH